MINLLIAIITFVKFNIKATILDLIGKRYSSPITKQTKSPNRIETSGKIEVKKVFEDTTTDELVSKEIAASDDTVLLQDSTTLLQEQVDETALLVDGFILTKNIVHKTTIKFIGEEAELYETNESI
ncbi:hypothetical protein J2T56_001413 [Natronobacillus azotifigens]|uniref:Uncharacterized protein n=1 Tax=Natronobacillus azotifigens TaxID=472978 RepID=A0A9J6RC96_9BACI|nr:hypothetical protein [Natronobacillus azotifigens]MCZ0703149.1 hypothetical protein [Natronobacillus azotifigens]